MDQYRQSRQYGQTLSGDYPRYARVRAMVSDMLYTDPVVYDWQHIETKALVIGGEEDDLADDFGPGSTMCTMNCPIQLCTSIRKLAITLRLKYLISSIQI